ncbi:MAG: hypothetical protein WC755_09520 [Candidatus Woesearchaeota archaeon]|jgi:hypothetical protein
MTDCEDDFGGSVLVGRLILECDEYSEALEEISRFIFDGKYNYYEIKQVFVKSKIVRKK